jgi:hypothetical protein
MRQLAIEGDAFHPEWNYTIKPRRPTPLQRLLLQVSLYHDRARLRLASRTRTRRSFSPDPSPFALSVEDAPRVSAYEVAISQKRRGVIVIQLAGIFCRTNPQAGFGGKLQLQMEARISAPRHRQHRHHRHRSGAFQIRARSSSGYVFLSGTIGKSRGSPLDSVLAERAIVSIQQSAA